MVSFFRGTIARHAQASAVAKHTHLDRERDCAACLGGGGGGGDACLSGERTDLVALGGRQLQVGQLQLQLRQLPLQLSPLQLQVTAGRRRHGWQQAAPGRRSRHRRGRHRQTPATQHRAQTNLRQHSQSAAGFCQLRRRRRRLTEMLGGAGAGTASASSFGAGSCSVKCTLEERTGVSTPLKLLSTMSCTWKRHTCKHQVTHPHRHKPRPSANNTPPSVRSNVQHVK